MTKKNCLTCFEKVPRNYQRLFYNNFINRLYIADSIFKKEIVLYEIIYYFFLSVSKTKILNEMRTFLCRLSINDCNKLIIYLSTYFTTNKKVYIMFSLCVSLELSKLTLVTTSLSTLSSNFSKGKNFYLVGGSVYYCLVTSDSSYHHATGLNN